MEMYFSSQNNVQPDQTVRMTFGKVRDLPPPCCVLEQDTLLPESTG